MNVRSTKLLHEIWTWEECVEKSIQKNVNDDQEARRNEMSAEMLNGSKLNRVFLIGS
jgi:hypothetical protein